MTIVPPEHSRVQIRITNDVNQAMIANLISFRNLRFCNPVQLIIDSFGFVLISRALALECVTSGLILIVVCGLFGVRKWPHDEMKLWYHAVNTVLPVRQKLL